MNRIERSIVFFLSSFFLIISLKSSVAQENTVVKNYRAIDSVINSFQKVAFADLDSAYLQAAKLLEPDYRDLFLDRIYLVIKAEDMKKLVVDSFTVDMFIPKDQFYNEVLRGVREYTYWSVKAELLYMLHDLQLALEKDGLNKRAFWIENSYRHPADNEAIGGAKLSRHLYGDAIDLMIEDINSDGTISVTDRDVVLKILTEKVVQDRGGVGRYGDSMSIHFDARGSKARWGGL